MDKRKYIEQSESDYSVVSMSDAINDFDITQSKIQIIYILKIVFTIEQMSIDCLKLGSNIRNNFNQFLIITNLIW